MKNRQYHANAEKSADRFGLLPGNKFYFAAILFSFFVPFLIGHFKDLPMQLFVGTAVNFLLTFAALKFSARQTLPIILLPALGAYFSGFVFGSASIYLLYLIPFIWAGNAIYAISIRKIKNFVSVPIASFLKAGLIFCSTLACVSLSIVPAVFLLPMGLMQLITALAGGCIGFLFIKNALK